MPSPLSNELTSSSHRSRRIVHALKPVIGCKTCGRSSFFGTVSLFSKMGTTRTFLLLRAESNSTRTRSFLSPRRGLPFESLTGLPLWANQCQQHLACPEGALDLNFEIHTWCDVIEVKERSAQPEQLIQRVI